MRRAVGSEVKLSSDSFSSSASTFAAVKATANAARRAGEREVVICQGSKQLASAVAVGSGTPF